MSDKREDAIITSACLYGDCFMCTREAYEQRLTRTDGKRVCECECHDEEADGSE